MKATLFFIILWFILVILPAIFQRAAAVRLEGRISVLKKIRGTDTATFIVQGMFGTPDYYWEDYARFMPGDVFFLDWSQTSGFDPKIVAKQVVDILQRKKYKEVHFINVSIGDMITSPFGSLLWKWETAKMSGWAVPPVPKVEIFSLDSLTDVNVVKPALRPMFLIGAPVAIVIRWLLGWFGSIPCIRVDGLWHSLGEITEQFLAIATSEYTYKDAPIAKYAKNASISKKVWYMRKSDGKWSNVLDLKAVLPEWTVVHSIDGSLCNINDPLYGRQLAKILGLAGMYNYNAINPLARYPKDNLSEKRMAELDAENGINHKM